jgi:hypothetical protein
VNQLAASLEQAGETKQLAVFKHEPMSLHMAHKLLRTMVKTHQVLRNSVGAHANGTGKGKTVSH